MMYPIVHPMRKKNERMPRICKEMKDEQLSPTPEKNGKKNFTVSSITATIAITPGQSPKAVKII